MAAPTDPTLITLTVNALKLSGYRAAQENSTEQTLAEEWMQRLKNEIWSDEKKLKTLHTTNYYTIVDGEGLISNPSDYASHLAITLLEPTHFGVCQNGGNTTTFVLAATEDIDQDIIGKEILVWVTNAAATTKIQSHSGFVTSYNETTKTGKVSLAWTVSPDATYSYMIIDKETRLDEEYIGNYNDRESTNYRNYMTYYGRSFTRQGRPINFYPFGDSSSDKYMLDPVPYRTDSIPWAIRERYYANLITIDLTEGATTLITKIYREWQHAFNMGIMWLSYEYQRMTSEAESYQQKWLLAKQQLLSMERDGMDLSNLAVTIQDYDA